MERFGYINSSVTPGRFSSLCTWVQSDSGRAGFSSNVGGVNSRRSSSTSSTPVGTGHAKSRQPAADTHQPSIGTPTVMAICRSGRAAVLGLLEPSASALSRRASDLPLHGRKGGLVRDSIVDSESFRSASQGGRLHRNGWPTSVGIGGRIASESVADFRRITQSVGNAHRPIDILMRDFSSLA